MYTVGAVRIGDIDGELVVNPTRQQLEHSILNLVLTSTEHRIGKNNSIFTVCWKTLSIIIHICKISIVMLEGHGKEVSSSRLIEAIQRGHKEVRL